MFHQSSKTILFLHLWSHGQRRHWGTLQWIHFAQDQQRFGFGLSPRIWANNCPWSYHQQFRKRHSEGLKKEENQLCTLTGKPLGFWKRNLLWGHIIVDHHGRIGFQHCIMIHVWKQLISVILLNHATNMNHDTVNIRYLLVILFHNAWNWPSSNDDGQQRWVQHGWSVPRLEPCPLHRQVRCQTPELRFQAEGWVSHSSHRESPRYIKWLTMDKSKCYINS